MLPCRMAAVRPAIFCSLIALASGGLSPAHAQEAPPAPTPAPAPGTQVQTGSTLGASNQSLLSRIAALLNDRQYPEVERMVEESAGQNLTPEQKQMVRGVLANRENKLEDSIQLLQPLVNELNRTKDAPPAEEK